MLMYLLPLHLSHSEDAIDFVLHVFAAYIIVKLDCVFEPGEIQHAPSELKVEKPGKDASETTGL